MKSEQTQLKEIAINMVLSVPAGITEQLVTEWFQKVVEEQNWLAGGRIVEMTQEYRIETRGRELKNLAEAKFEAIDHLYCEVKKLCNSELKNIFQKHITATLKMKDRI